MARLVDLLEWLARPGRERIWVLLDIKVCCRTVLKMCQTHSCRLTMMLMNSLPQLAMRLTLYPPRGRSVSSWAVGTYVPSLPLVTAHSRQ